MEQLIKYFPNLSEKQIRQFTALRELYTDWNSKINVISRKDIDNLYEHHILHSLGIAKVIKFAPGTNIMDLGTGGGFPGIPLAILFPECKVHLVDSIGKKFKVATEDKYHFVVTRAVMPLIDLMKTVKKNIGNEQFNLLPNGIIALKGGELNAEMASMKNICTTWDLKDYFNEEFFETKKVVHVTVNNK